MIIRFANNSDLPFIVREIEAQDMDYNTPADAREDIAAGRMIVAEDNGIILASVIVKYKAHRDYYAIMRMCVYSNNSRGKGVASALIDFILSLNLGTYGATPWDDNPAMLHIFEKRGFVYQYTFKKHYCFYKKSA